MENDTFWVRILRTGRHTPTKNSQEHPPGAAAGAVKYLTLGQGGVKQAKGKRSPKARCERGPLGTRDRGRGSSSLTSRLPSRARKTGKIAPVLQAIAGVAGV